LIVVISLIVDCQRLHVQPRTGHGTRAFREKPANTASRQTSVVDPVYSSRHDDIKPEMTSSVVGRYVVLQPGTSRRAPLLLAESHSRFAAEGELSVITTYPHDSHLSHPRVLRTSRGAFALIYRYITVYNAQSSL